MKIAILGTASSSRNLAPFDDPEWDIWALAHQVDQIPRATEAFELHSRGVWGKTRADYLPLMNGLTIPLWMQASYPDVPNAQVFPRDEILDKFKRPYFTSSASWMLAWAIMRKPTHIGIWGIDMLSDGEYADQRPCMEFLLGLAAGRGITLAIPEASALLKADHQYGYETKPDRSSGAISRAILERDIAKYEKRLRELEQEFQAMNALKTQCEVYLDYVGHFERTGVRPAL